MNLTGICYNRYSYWFYTNGSLRASWVLGTLLPQWWQLGRVWDPEDATAEICLFSHGRELAEGPRLGAEWMLSDRVTGLCRDSTHLKQRLDLRVEKLSLGTLPFLVSTAHNICFGGGEQSCDLTSKTKDLIPKSLQQLTTPSAHLSYKRLCW